MNRFSISSIRRAVGVVDHVGRELAGGGLGLDAGDELAAGRAHHLDLDLREALVEGLDHLLLDLGEVGRVEDERPFFLGRLDQLGRSEVLRRGRRARAPPSRPSAVRIDFMPTVLSFSH